MKRNKQELYDKMGLSKEDVNLLNDYFDAFSNFYGRLSLRTAFEIINEQNDNRFSEEVLLKFAESKKLEKRFYYIVDVAEFFDDCYDLDSLDQEIANDSLFAVDDEDYYDLCEAQDGKPICVLPKKDLLRFADDSYREETVETLALEKFLEENVKIKQPSVSLDCVNTAKDLVDEYILGITIKTDFASTGLDDLLRLAELPKDENELMELLGKLLPLMNEVSNNTRIWANRGYTPSELGVLLGGPKLENLRMFVEPIG